MTGRPRRRPRGARWPAGAVALAVVLLHVGAVMGCGLAPIRAPTSARATPEASVAGPSRSAEPGAPTPSSTTPALPPASVLATGDIGECGGKGDERTAGLLAEHHGTILPLGDLAYESGTAQEFQACFGTSWGPFRDRMRPVPGNHEYKTPGAAPYFAYFGTAAGDPTEGYYAYNLGAWRLYALNSNCDEIGGCGVGDPQETWLRGDLAAHPAVCILAYWHHARFSSGDLHGSDARTDALWQALEGAGADIVLSGHDHHYERFAPQDHGGRATPKGIRQFVVGTGGSGLRAMGSLLPTSEAHLARVYGLLSLELRSDGYAWAFLPANGASATDAGSGTCTPIPPRAAAATAP